MADGNINIDIKLDSNNFDKEIDGIIKTTQGKLDTIGTNMQKMGTSISNVGTKMTTAITLPILGLTAGIAKIGAEFDYEMSKVQALSGATGEDLIKLKDKAKLMGATTKFSATESAEAFKYMAMAGWETTDMLDGLDGIMMAAAASSEELALVSDIITDGLTAFGLTAKDSAKFADILAVAASDSNTDIAAMGEAFKYAAPLAGVLDASVEEVGVAMGIMANSGVKASQAGTTLRGLFQRMTDTTSESEQAMANFGITTEDLTELGLAATLDKIREASKDMTSDQILANSAMLAGKTGMTGLATIINATEEDYKTFTERIYNAEGAAKAMAETIENNLQGRLTILKSSLEGVALQLYDLLLPAFEKAVEKVQNLVTAFANLDETTKMDIIKGAGIIAAIGPLLIVFGKLATLIGTIIKLIPLLKTAFTMLTGPVGIVIAVISGLVFVFQHLWETNEEFKNNIINSWNSIKDSVSNIIDTITSIFNNFISIILDETDIDVFKDIWNSVLEFFKIIFESIFKIIDTVFSAIADFLKKHEKEITDTLVGAWKGIESIIIPTVEIIYEVVKKIFDALQKFWEIWGDDIIKIFNNTLTNLKNTFSFAWETIKNIIETVVNIISGILKTFLAILKGDWETASNEVKGIVQSMTDFIKNQFNIIKDFLSNISLYQIGADIMNGLINGVTNKINDLKNVMNNVANTVVSSAKEALNIHSPSRVMADEVGEEVTAGIAQGQLNNLSSIDKANAKIKDKLTSLNLSNMYDRMTLGIQTTGSMLASKFGGSGATNNTTTTNNDNGITVNVNYSGTGADEEIADIGRRLGEETQRALRARGLSYA